MKRTYRAWAVVLALAAVFLTSLYLSSRPQAPETHAPSPERPSALKTGLWSQTRLSSSQSAAPDKPGAAQGDTLIAAVMIDGEGRLRSCKIDEVQTRVTFDAAGAITTSTQSQFFSKMELGDGYQMKRASSIGKEWYEQINALISYLLGKTEQEITGLSVDAQQKSTDPDLTASCTIAIGPYLQAVAAAMDRADHHGAQEGDVLGLGVVSAVSPYCADADMGDGNAQSDTTFLAATRGADGAITSCLIDAVQAKVSFDAAGVITSPLDKPIPSKSELGDEYRMKHASPIGKEWYEQTAAFCRYLVGKTLSEATGIAVDQENRPMDADLTAACTIAIGEFLTALQKALAGI